MQPEKLLTVEEIASWLGLKPSWVYAHADVLGVYRLGKYLRFSPGRVMARLERGLGQEPNDPANLN